MLTDYWPSTLLFLKKLFPVRLTNCCFVNDLKVICNKKCDSYQVHICSFVFKSTSEIVWREAVKFPSTLQIYSHMLWLQCLVVLSDINRYYYSYCVRMHVLCVLCDFMYGYTSECSALCMKTDLLKLYTPLHMNLLVTNTYFLLSNFNDAKCCAITFCPLV